MKKYRYQKIVRKPAADVQFFEDYLESQGEHDKRTQFLDLVSKLRAIYNSNPSYCEVNNSTDQTIYAEYSHDELDHIIRQSKTFSETYTEVHHEWVRYLLENNIYYSTTVKEIKSCPDLSTKEK